MMVNALEVRGKGGTCDVESLEDQAVGTPGVSCVCPGNAC